MSYKTEQEEFWASEFNNDNLLFKRDFDEKYLINIPI